MVAAIGDTHAVLWYLYADPRLSTPAKLYLDGANAAGEQVGVSAVTLAEAVYLAEKGRIPAKALADLLTAFDASSPLFVEVPFDRLIAQAMMRVPRSAVPDLPDRIIAATAVHMGVPLLSRDRKIQLSAVQTIW